MYGLAIIVTMMMTTILFELYGIAKINHTGYGCSLLYM
jgi:hypothetical protein